MGNVKQANLMHELMAALAKIKGGMSAGVAGGADKIKGITAKAPGAARVAGSYTGEMGAGMGNQLSEIIAKLIGANTKGVKELATSPFRNLKQTGVANNPRALGESLVNTGIATAPVALGANMFGKSSEDAYYAGVLAECQRRGVDPRSIKLAQVTNTPMSSYPTRTGVTRAPNGVLPQSAFPEIKPSLPTHYLANSSAAFRPNAGVIAGAFGNPLLALAGIGANNAVSDYEGRNQQDYLRGLQDALGQDQAQLVPQSPKAILKPWGWGNFRRNTGRLIERGFDSAFHTPAARVRVARLKQINSDLGELNTMQGDVARLREQSALNDSNALDAERDALSAQGDFKANERGYNRMRGLLMNPSTNNAAWASQPVQQPTVAPLPPSISAPGKEVF